MRGALSHRLPAWSLMGAVISAAGLPIYIYAPHYYADNYGVTLTTLGLVLLYLRFFDVVQDPAMGWVAERLRRGRALAVACAAILLSLSMLGLFAVRPPISPVWWFGLTITGLFTAFSFLTICFYGQGVAKARDLPGGDVQLAAWREGGALFGVCIAAVTPTVLIGVVDRPFATFAWGFAAVVAVAVFFMAREWRGQLAASEPVPIRAIFSDRLASRLLILALVNATPLAVSSTLFLFFVESRLDAAGWEGPLLVIFFLSAAISAPVWSSLAARIGPKPVLLGAMVVAVVSFGITLTLGAGDQIWFAIICVITGATIGADLTLLPAIFARRMGRVAPNGGQGFGLWSLMNKATLAISAAILLPLIEGAGVTAGADVAPPQSALNMLTWLYAGLPVALKLVAIALLAATRLEDDR